MPETQYVILSNNIGLLAATNIQRIDYSSKSDISITYAGLVHVTNTIARLSNSETSFNKQDPAAPSTRERQPMCIL